MKYKTGMRFYSKYFKQWGTVTRYYNPEHWYFVLDRPWWKKLLFIKNKELRAKSHPAAVRWVKEGK